MPLNCLWSSEKDNQIMTNTELETEATAMMVEDRELYTLLRKSRPGLRREGEFSKDEDGFAPD